MWEAIVSGLVVAALSGAVGFLVKLRFFTNPQYLPTVSSHESLRKAYYFIPGEWHEYHFTYDPKIGKGEYLAHSVFRFSLQKNLVVTGSLEVKADHRRSLRYRIRGQISNGNFYYTGVCIDDPSDSFCSMFRNLLDDQILGVTVGWDYSKESFVSPTLLVKKELQQAEAENLLKQFEVKLFGGKQGTP
ncbi:hypothetical protein BST81_11870 [Leptolyngbya sp. 'hensonii']|uniref:hypothetical protein n=1 Tax=Leptolyngbya sp. 'hensonii' TaxID=1922337 RepID=UPI00094FDF05|nr:hypothetical protein [Leptolyngbya sp. 'hensonii']OLP18217.1 hypothetical protein BST81_11870 [Leptolyngbya sp. 'hensonii']